MCGKELPATAENFYRSRRGIGGLASWCKACRKATNKEYREGHC